MTLLEDARLALMDRGHLAVVARAYGWRESAEPLPTFVSRRLARGLAGDAALSLVGDLAALIPLPQSLEALKTNESMVAWFKNVRTQALKEAAELCRKQANDSGGQDYYTSGALACETDILALINATPYIEPKKV